MEVRMRPGDLLYIPRGFYHDAVAFSEASLHVTFSVARHTGRVLFRLLEELAMQRPEFRAYLPDGREEEGRPLAERLETLGATIQMLIRSPLFRNALTNRQLALGKPVRQTTLPERPRMQFFKRVAQDVRIVRGEEGAMLVWRGGQASLGLLEEPAGWFLAQGVVSMEQLVARYPQHGAPALGELVALLRHARLIEKVG
jgi:bifunctional lysine-specific demethylase and histidyl-hydroxylase NO66